MTALGIRRRGKPPTKMLAAAAWVAMHPELMCLCSESIRYRRAGPYSEVNPHWRRLANAVRDAGFFSRTTGAIDVPVRQIAQEALRIIAAERSL